MARTLLLRIDPTASDASWQLVENSQLVGPLGKGKLSDARRVARGVSVVVLVPAEEIYLDNVALPGKNRQKLRRAIPFVVEDQIIDDVESLHFALSTHSEQGRYLVAAVDDRMMDYWDKAMINAGIRVDAMIPDVTALPRAQNEWTIMLESERALVRTSGTLFATELASLPIMLENMLSRLGEGEAPTFTIYDCGGEDKALLLKAEMPDIEFNVHDVPQGVFDIFARSYDPRHSVNLLQGEYNRQEGWRKQLRPWYPAAALLGIWLAWQLVLDIGNYIDLSRASEQLTTQMRIVHRQAFPGAKLPPPGYERSDMEARIRALQKSQGRAVGGLQEMLVRTAPILKKTPGIILDGIRYQDGKLEVELTMQDTNQLETLKNQLQSQTGWKVKSQANTDKGITRVRLKIESSNT